MRHNASRNILAGLGLGLGLAFLLVGLPILTGAQGPIGHTFTYQGRLLKGGFYVDGLTCDFRFSLYDAPVGGTQAGTTQTVSGVTVRDGYFSAELNSGDEFGAGAFTGDKRYLQIATRCGSETRYTAMDERVPLNAAPYALYARNVAGVTSIPWSRVTGKPPGFADDVDDVVTYTNGYGLDMVGNEFSVVSGTVLSAISDTWQRRVTGSCADPEAIQVINADGSVLCGTSSITYTAGEGLSLTGNVFAIDDSVVQRLVTGDCGGYGSGRAMRVINQDGTVTCEPVPQGDVTAVMAGDGLAGTDTGGPVVGLQVADYGITAGMLADSAVTTDKIADSAVGTAQLDSGAISSDHIYSLGDDSRKIQFEDLFLLPCSNGQVIKRNNSATTPPLWECKSENSINFTPGAGVSLAGAVISLKVNGGVAISTDGTQSLEVDFGGTGSQNKPARSDHSHDEYVRKDGDAPPGHDVEGTYNDGLTVVSLRGQPVANANPAQDKALRFVSGQWQPADYYTSIDLGSKVTRYESTGTSSSNGIIQVSCGTGEIALGGGCQCKDDYDVQDSYPSAADTWYCDCRADTQTTLNKAWIICIKEQYP